MPSFATLIIAYHRDDLVASALADLAAQSLSPDLLIVVDNGGDLDESVIGGPFKSRVKLIRRPDNPGYATAVNIAARHTRDAGINRLLVLTHDAHFDSNLSARLSAVLDERPTVGAVAPVLVRASDPQRIFSAGGRIGRGARAFHLTERQPGVSDVDWVDGAIVLYRLDALDAIDGLDERYFLYYEDVDTGWAMAREGWRTVVVGGVTAQQEPGAHPAYLGIRNLVLFAKKSGRRRTAIWLAVMRRIAEDTVVAVLRGRIPDWRGACKGWRDGNRGLSGKPIG